MTMKNFAFALPILVTLIFTVSCGKAPSDFNADETLKLTATKLSNPLFEVSNIVYSDISNTAIKNLVPTAGMPFRVSGTVVLRATSDLYKEVPFLLLSNHRRIEEVQKAYDKWGIRERLIT